MTTKEPWRVRRGQPPPEIPLTDEPRDDVWPDALDEAWAALRAIREVIEAHVPPDVMVNFERMPGAFGPESDELIRGILAIARARGLGSGAPSEGGRRVPRKPPKRPAMPPAVHLSAAEMSLLERLVDRGALVTVPALKSQKPRKVIAAALAEHGSRVLLYLSAKTTELESDKT